MHSFGKIAGGLGLLLLLSSPVTLLMTSGSLLHLAVKAAIGATLILVYLATHYRKWRGKRTASTPSAAMKASTKASFFYVTSALLVVIAVGALTAANVIAAQRNRTWDLTRKQIFSLAPQTTSLLKALPDPVKAIAFVPPHHPYYDSIEELLRKYANESQRFAYEFKDPRKFPDLAARYQLKEGETPLVLVRGESHASLELISEQELTNALLKLTTVGSQKFYFLTGHGEWSLEPPGTESKAGLTELRRSLLQDGYTVEPLNLIERGEIPLDAAALVIAGAKLPFAENEKALLRQYLEQGGRLLYFAEAKQEPGLDGLLAEYGIQVDNGLVADERVNPRNPYELVSAFFAEHDITKLIEQLEMHVYMPSSRGLTLLREGHLPGVTTLPLVLSSPYAWVETTLDDRPALGDGEKSGAIPLVVLSHRDTAQVPQKRFDEARLVVFGDSELLVNALWGHEGNRNLVLNAFAWASAQVTKLTIRPPDRDISTVELDDKRLTQIRFVAMDLLPLALMGMGLAIWLSRRNK